MNEAVDIYSCFDWRDPDKLGSQYWHFWRIKWVIIDRVSSSPPSSRETKVELKRNSSCFNQNSLRKNFVEIKKINSDITYQFICKGHTVFKTIMIFFGSVNKGIKKGKNWTGRSNIIFINDKNFVICCSVSISLFPVFFRYVIGRVRRFGRVSCTLRKACVFDGRGPAKYS